MPSTKVANGRQKPVFVTVYVEKEKKVHHHHHHHHHVYVHQPLMQNKRRGSGNNSGYNRRAELLDYSHRLRASAREPSITQPPKPSSSSSSNITAAASKPNQLRASTSLRNWKILIPGCLRLFSGKERKKKRASVIIAAMKSCQVKKPGFMSKLISKFRKRKP